MKKYGFVATGGGYRSFYTGGVLVWLKKQGIPVVHINSNSSGNNIVMDYLIWDWEKEELPPVINSTFRMNLKDIFDVFSNFSGLKPSFIPNGSYLFSVDKGKLSKSLLMEEAKRRELLKEHLNQITWDIVATNLTKRKREVFYINKILKEINQSSMDKFMDAFVAGITTIPYFKAIKIEDEYYLEGGYIDNTPLRTVFENPDVDEIIVVDFTDYDYHTEIDEMYKKSPLGFLQNGIEMNKLVNDIELNLPNSNILSQANLTNKLIQSTGKKSIKIDDRTFYYKPLHILKPKDLKSMTISLQDVAIPKQYFQLGQTEVEEYFKSL